MTEGEIKFDARGLVPAIVQDARTRDVLMLAYMNAESLRRTLETRETWFWSRSRAELWHKGATSGNVQRVKRVSVDCDADALLFEVTPAGAACHTGARSCFFRELEMSEDETKTLDEKQTVTDERSATDDKKSDFKNEHASSELKNENSSADDATLGATLESLYQLIERRRAERPENSYTSYLFNSGLDKILKKVGEESAETIIAAKNADEAAFVSEISDLIYHLLVLMVERGASLDGVRAELAKRAGKSGAKGKKGE